MTRLIPIFALFLSGCVDRSPLVIPDEFLEPVVVSCAPGATARALGNCAVALRSGLNEANGKIAGIAELVKGPR